MTPKGGETVMTTVFVMRDSSHNSLKLPSICARITCFAVLSCSFPGNELSPSSQEVLTFCVYDCFVVVHYVYDHMQASPWKLLPSRWAYRIISMWTMYYFTCTVSTLYILSHKRFKPLQFRLRSRERIVMPGDRCCQVSLTSTAM